MKDELGEQLIKEFVSLIAKTYGYLKGNKAQKVCHKKKFKFQDYKNCLEN